MKLGNFWEGSMAVQQVLTRLLRLRELEEEMIRLELEGAVVERTQAERLLQAVLDRRTESRLGFVQGIESADRLQRADAQMILSRADLEVQLAGPVLIGAEREVDRLKGLFLEQRTARQQVETLVTDARQAAKVETARRAQQMLDDWYGRRIRSQQKISRRPARNAFDCHSGE